VIKITPHDAGLTIAGGRSPAATTSIGASRIPDAGACLRAEFDPGENIFGQTLSR